MLDGRGRKVIANRRQVVANSGVAKIRIGNSVRDVVSNGWSLLDQLPDSLNALFNLISGGTGKRAFGSFLGRGSRDDTEPESLVDARGLASAGRNGRRLGRGRVARAAVGG